MALSFENFDLDFYLYMNDNLEYDFIKNKKKAYEDYSKNINSRIVSYDKKILDNFDPLVYLLCNKDLKKLNIKNDKYAKFHFLKFGQYEDRVFSIQHVKKILPNFNWIEYIYINKFLLHKLTNNRDCLIHYLIYGINFNKKYKTDKEICLDFDWIIYKNYYHDLNFIDNYKDAFSHYIKVGIDEERNEWINLRNILYNIDEEKYKKINSNVSNINKKKDLIHDWIKNDKNGKILITNNKNINFNKEFCIAVSVYSDDKTPKERLLASFKCLNYLFLLIQNCNIYIVIDGSINNEHFNFIKKLKRNYKNCFIYKNKKNYGIAVTKNISIKILNNNKDIKYFCLMDDDIFIKRNFVDYSINILNSYNIPVLTNFNKGLPYFENHYKESAFVKSNFFLGNILIFTKNFFKKFGYFREFPYKWGEEHQEFTKRYLYDSKYKYTTIDFRKYINDEFVFGNVNTLHLHSLKVDHNKVKLNKKKYFEYIKSNKYVYFNLDKYKVEEI